MCGPVKINAHRSNHAIALIVLVVLTAIGFGFLLQPGRVPYSPFSDVIAQGLATKTVLYESLHSGHGIPFWRDDQLSGNAGLINPQSLYTYPLHALFYFARPENVIGITFWLHFLAAGVVLYIVGGSLGLRWPARLLMAVTAAFSFKLILATFAGWLPAIPGLVTFPLLFASVFYACRKPGLIAALYVGGAVALSLHAGNMQILYYSGLFLLVFALQWRALTTLLAGGVLGVALSAYLVIPLAAESALVSRSAATYDFFKTGHAIQPRHLLTFLYPEATGTPLNEGQAPELWEDVAYFGILPLLLALVGITLGRRRPLTLYLSIALLAALVLALQTPIHRFLFDTLPGFHLFRNPSRFLFLTAFFGTCLAGIGFDELLGRRSKRVAMALSVLAIGWIAAEGSLYARRYLRVVPVEQVLPKTEYSAWFAQDSDVYRIASFHRFSVNYGWAVAMKLHLIGGYDPFNYRHYQQYMDILQTGNVMALETRVWTDFVNLRRRDLLDALNVKYLVLPNGPSPPGFTSVASFAKQPVFVFYRGLENADLSVFRNDDFRQRAFWVDEVAWANTDQAAVDQVLRKNLRTTAIIQSTQISTDVIGPSSAEDAVGSIAATNDTASFQLHSRAPRYLVLSEVWHPGWQAQLDDKPLKLYKTNVALMGAFIPAGDHVLRLTFRPLFWRASLGMSAISLLVAGLLLARGFVRAIPHESHLKFGRGGANTDGS